MKRGATEHPKMLDLMERLACTRREAVGVVELLLHYTARFAPLGDIGKWTDQAIAKACDWPNADDLIAALRGAGWLDDSETHRLLVHDWPEHSDDAVHLSVARSRRLFADGCMPRISRLGKTERSEIEPVLMQLHADWTRAHGMRTESAPPSPPIPSPAKPSREAGATRSASADAPPAASEIFLTFPTVGPQQTWQLTRAQLEEWATLFPGLDVERECRLALYKIERGMVPKKTAGPRGMQKFLLGWLGRAVNDPRGSRSLGATPAIPAIRPAVQPKEDPHVRRVRVGS